MTGRTWLCTSVVAMVALASGCVATGHEGAKLAREAGPSCETPLENRNQVYVFVVGGNNPIEWMGLDKFREGLNARGFAKVATGPSVYSGWMASEMKRIHKEQPEAVFVIAGLDSAAEAAVKLSEKAAGDGIPMQGVVIVDASGKTPAPNVSARTLMVGANYGILTNTNAEHLVITAPGEMGLSAEPRTIGEVVAMLNEIAISNPPPPKPEAPLTSVYPFAPDIELTLDHKLDSEWSFLFDQPGGMTRKIDEPIDLRISAITSTQVSSQTQTPLK